jgi:nitrate reductase gamma subunit
LARPVMFSSKLEQRRKARRFALLVAVSVLLIGVALISVVAVQGFDMLGVAEADRMPVVMAIGAAFGGLLVFSIVAYIAARIVTRVP